MMLGAAEKPDSVLHTTILGDDYFTTKPQLPGRPLRHLEEEEAEREAARPATL